MQSLCVNSFHYADKMVCGRFLVFHNHCHQHGAIDVTAWRKLRYDDLWPLTPSHAGGGSGRGHGCGGRSRSSPLLDPRPVCSNSKMRRRAFQNPHLFGCEQISGPCVFQRKCWGKRFSWQHPCTWQCELARLCLFCVPTLSRSPSTLISVMFTGQNATQPPKNPA